MRSDILVLNEGDAVGADARLLTAAALRVSEASLTGERESVTKNATTLAERVPLGDRKNMVFPAPRWCTEEVTKKWRDLTRAQRTAVLALASVQLSLAAAAWADLAIRPAEQVVGGKAKWAVVIGINFVGPLLYFTRGRRASS